MLLDQRVIRLPLVGIVQQATRARASYHTAREQTSQKVAAIDAGVEIPAEWPDPLRKMDKGKPDIGALPLGADFEPVRPRRGGK